MTSRVGQVVRWRVMFLTAALGAAMLMTTPMVWAQSAGSTIHGTVKDESGGAMPGVTVTLKSPSLQVPQLVVVSDTDGNYRFGDLPAGTYRIAFELAGFKSVVVPELRLAIGF